MTWVHFSKMRSAMAQAECRRTCWHWMAVSVRDHHCDGQELFRSQVSYAHCCPVQLSGCSLFCMHLPELGLRNESRPVYTCLIRHVIKLASSHSVLCCT